MLPLGVCYLHKTSTALFSIRIRQYRINTAPNLLQKFELLKKKKEKFAFLLFFWKTQQENAHVRKRCQVFRYIFLFSQYYSLTLHSQRFATLPLETPYRGAVRLKGNGVRVPDCPAAVSRPYLRARTREPLKPCISVLSAWVWQDAIPSYALGRCSRLGGESEDLPKLICRWSHRRAPRGLGAYDRNTYII